MDWSDRIGRRIKLRDLHILMAVADTGSMAKAAARLRISHPAVSKAISEIEGTLGVRLFDRNSQGVELTAHGEVLLRCGINVFDEMQQGLRSLEHLSDPNSGEVRLGCTDIILHSLVPPIVRKFSARYPGVQLDVRLTNPGEHQVQELLELKIDLLITRATGQQEDFHSEGPVGRIVIRRLGCEDGGLRLRLQSALRASPVGVFLVKQNDTHLRAGFSDRSSLIKWLPHRGLSIHPNCG